MTEIPYTSEAATAALAKAIDGLPLSNREEDYLNETAWDIDRVLMLVSIITKARQTGVTAQPAPAKRVDGRCSWCRDLMPVPMRPQRGGKTKKFCSSACRQAEYRWRHDPERYPDREQWVTARKGMFAKLGIPTTTES